MRRKAKTSPKPTERRKAKTSPKPTGRRKRVVNGSPFNSCSEELDSPAKPAKIPRQRKRKADVSVKANPPVIRRKKGKERAKVSDSNSECDQDSPAGPTPSKIIPKVVYPAELGYSGAILENGKGKKGKGKVNVVSGQSLIEYCAVFD